jgi:hypothetical protein
MAIDKHQAADDLIKQKFKLERSPAWPATEEAFKKLHPKCAACGGTAPLNVHHKFPFHYVVLCNRPDLELDPRNLMTLCTDTSKEHHVLLGHLDDYESYNPDVMAFVATYANKTSQQIRADAAFRTAHGKKPEHLDLMTQQQKGAFTKMLDQKLPPDPTIVAKAKAARAKLAVQ